MNNCGCTHWLHSFSPVRYVIKERYEDFIVQEVDPAGNIVPLTISDAVEEATVEEPTVNTTAVLMGLFSDEAVVMDIEAFFDDRSRDQFVVAALLTKEQRMAVHTAFKQAPFFPAFVTDTHEGHLRISRKNSAARTYDARNDQVKQFVQFFLHKINMDTIDAMGTIARRLHLPAKNFSYAGTKDRRAVTVQRVVVRNCPIGKLMGFNRIGVPGVRLGNPQLVQGPLKFGDLSGNRFTIIMRHVEDTATLAERMLQVCKQGFVNFFGPQRFGSSASVCSHDIGVVLMKGAWESAVNLILGPRSDDFGPVKDARIKWAETRDPELCKGLFPFWCHGERQLLAHLERSPTDYRGAIGSLSRELRMMYVHAVQSFLWNVQASIVISSGQLPQSNTLPVLGYENITNDKEESLLARLGLIAEHFKPTPQNETLWDLRGTDRTLIVKPVDMHGEIIDGKTFRLSFILPASSYATVLLRELMGIDPSNK